MSSRVESCLPFTLIALGFKEYPKILSRLWKEDSRKKRWGVIFDTARIVIQPSETNTHEAVRALSDKIGEKEIWQSEHKWRKEDEILDDHWVQKSRKKGQEKGVKPEAGHLEGLKWEVIVVNEPVINAFCLPGGKIVVFTGLLNHLKADAEIATIIGHEVSHAIARHPAEQISKNLWLTILQLILSVFHA